MYYKREHLINSFEGRKIDFQTISSTDKMIKDKKEPFLSDHLFPNRYSENRCAVFEKDKPVIFQSARVHPGETPASFGIRGVVKKLQKVNDKQSQLLRSLFVFKIIPIINPDGVYRGHFRKDGFGNNLNRFYDKADPVKQPAIFAILQILKYHRNEGKI